MTLFRRRPPPGFVLVDGCVASGKTTLAMRIVESRGNTHAAIVHLDEYSTFGWPRGGNLHLERLKEELVSPLESGRALGFRVTRNEIRTFLPSVVIMEGIFAFELRELVPTALRIWVDAPDSQRAERVAQRGYTDENLPEEFIKAGVAYAPEGRSYADLIVDGTAGIHLL